MRRHAQNIGVRAVIDTNVLLSGLLWHGPPHAVITHLRNGTLSLVTSPALLSELARVLGRPKFDAILTNSGVSREGALAELRQLAEVVEPPPLAKPICRDPDDDHVIACAIAAKADAIISGDRDLLDLREYQGIAILNANDALIRID